MKRRTVLVLDIPQNINESTKERYELYSYLEENGLLMDYLQEQTEKVYEEYLNKEKYMSDLSMFEESFEMNGKTYYILYTGNRAYKRYFVELPSIYDDDEFTWKSNIKTGTKEATLTDSVFDFECTFRADETVHIDVKYNKCSNLHRNRVSIAAFDVIEGNNYEIKNAISNWKKEFKEEIMSA